MSRKREPMRKIKEELRLSYLDCLSERQIALASNMHRSTVRDYLARAQACGVSWSSVADLDDRTIARQLFSGRSSGKRLKVAPDWGEIHKELRRSNVTLQLLWEEYRLEHPEGYGYSQFCNLYRGYASTLDLSMRQRHRAGESVFVDYCGHRIPVLDSETGVIRFAEIFVGVLGASNYTYADATWSQQKRDWIGSHCRMFAFFGGVCETVVPDNLKSAVTTASRYDPEINPTYQEWANHYGVAVLPARPRRPKDKAKVEVAVQVVERWILAALRHRTFFSLAELNAAISELLVGLNNRKFRKVPGTRASLFAALDQPALRPLPPTLYEYADYQKTTVPRDYHLDYDGHLYSVPYGFVGKTVVIRATATVIEVLHANRRIASHRRVVPSATGQKGQTSIVEHMSPGHRAHHEWDLDQLLAWSGEAGADIASLFSAIVSDRRHPRQAQRVCLGIKRLETKVGLDRLNAACRRALALGSLGTAAVENILERRQEELPLPWEAPALRLITHENVRGAAYYRCPTTDDTPHVEVPHAVSSHD
jgi:transposase